MGIVVIVLVGVLFVWRSRRRGSNTDEDVKMTPANGANAPPSDPLTVPDLKSLCANVANRTIQKTDLRKNQPTVKTDTPLADPPYINQYN